MSGTLPALPASRTSHRPWPGFDSLISRSAGLPMIDFARFIGHARSCTMIWSFAVPCATTGPTRQGRSRRSIA
jgi:hypothetical protein